jgi:hypothetical protein
LLRVVFTMHWELRTCGDRLQIDSIKRFDLERVFGNGNEAFVKYLCHTKNGKSFRNVEYLRFTDDKVEAIECYFGAQSSFPSAVDGQK